MTLPGGYRFPDVSHYRTVCDWGAYDGYPVSACKATEGVAGQDPYFAEWRGEMRARGLTPIAYHFLRTESSIADQVVNYLNVVDDGQPYGVMLDVETSGAGSNPTIGQANEWFDRVRDDTGIPRSQMLCYMPRWWWSAHGDGTSVLADTILWNSHFSLSPNLSDYAGDNVEVIQYSSTDLIDGVCPPGTGDMNIAIDLTAQQLEDKIIGTPGGGGFLMTLTDQQQTWLYDRIIRIERALSDDGASALGTGQTVLFDHQVGRKVEAMFNRAPGYFAKLTGTNTPVYYVAADHQSMLGPFDNGGFLHETLKDLHLVSGYSVNAVEHTQDFLNAIPSA